MSRPPDQMPAPQIERVLGFFVYPMPVMAVAPAARAQAEIQIEAATDFWWIKSAYIADVAGAAQTDATRIVPNVDVQLTTTGADRTLAQDFTPIPSWFGSQGLPFVLPFAQLITANSILKANIISREAAITLNIRLLFIGWKDYGEMRAAGPR